MQKAKILGGMDIAIRDIEIGDRARTLMGDLEGMVLSMNIEGQLVPVMVTLGRNGKYTLVDGERRILAAKQLGWQEIRCELVDNLTAVKKKELEIVMCVQRKQLTFCEEARAVRDLVDRRKRQAQVGSITQFNQMIKNKDIALELNMTESRMSENLRIAAAIEDHPELETECRTRSECISRIRRKEYFVPQGGILQSLYEENFIVQTPLGCLDTIDGKIIDLAILHPDKVDADLLDATYDRLKLGGQIVIFTTAGEIPAWTELLKEKKLNMGDQPYIWNIKNEGNYQMYLWAGKNMAGPIRAIPMMFGAEKPYKALSAKAKPLSLMIQIIKCCTERGGFVVVPECGDIETVRCCVEITRNIRAACNNKVLRDQLILSVVKPEE